MPLGIDITQILLHMFNVVLLFGGLYVIIYAPVKKIMQERENYYKELDEQAQSALAEAQQKNEEAEGRLKELEGEISQQKRKASLDIAAMRSNAEAEAKESANKIIDKAKKDAENQKQAIIESAKKDITEMVEEATRKVVLSGNTSEAYDMFLKNAERSGS